MMTRVVCHLMRPATLLIALLLSGCMGSAPHSGPTEAEGSPSHAPPAQDPGGVPQWEVGRWWALRLQSSFAEQPDMRARLVVAGQDANGYRLGTDALNVSLFDRYFDHVAVGPVDLGLNPTVLGRKVTLFPWPLEANKT